MTNTDDGALGALPDPHPTNVYQYGYGAVFMRDGGFFIIHRDDVGPLVDAWMAGRPFADARNEYGEDVWIKLAEVNAIRRTTPGGLQCQLDYDEWRRARERERKPFGD